MLSCFFFFYWQPIQNHQGTTANRRGAKERVLSCELNSDTLCLHRHTICHICRHIAICMHILHSTDSPLSYLISRFEQLSIHCWWSQIWRLNWVFSYFQLLPINQTSKYKSFFLNDWKQTACLRSGSWGDCNEISSLVKWENNPFKQGGSNIWH